MNEISTHIATLILPLMVSNVLHMLLVKHNKLSRLSIPVSQHLFGANKTWRGFVFVPVVNSVVLLAINPILKLHVPNAWLCGFVLGLAYMLAELPNSRLKRSLGIAPGGTHSRYRRLFALLDKMDSALGVTLAYWLMGMADAGMALFLFLAGSLTHIIASQILTTLHIKKSF